MTTSSNTSKTKKITRKKSQILPSNYHLPECSYVACIEIDGELYWSEYCETKEEAKKEQRLLEQKYEYDIYETKEDEGVYPERGRIMEDLYQKSGRTNSVFTGLNTTDVEISNNNTE